ncbi:AAA family ATPase [Chryseobacterium sp. C-71]|uniref:AAA family ATPase n=1 Tax=Chryseobacterium sp. C-71 TaxID=2893882 RepID=UPI001E3A4384|nr:AAA family ATPase [Chryseobacterium sp. C-71]UFH33031.1 AAA family ATPase [Chryseobacterium sp. C-71]
MNKDCFTGKYLIAIGKTEWGDLKWTDASIATKKSIINRADIVFTAAESIADFTKAKSQLTNQGVNDLLLDCSDAHYFSTETDKDRIGNCNTWIKAQPTFEGLRQILHEPNQRVSIQQNIPDQKDEKLVITEVSFISTNNLFSNDTIYFNDNLNVIIGGKSSGKSILLYHIAKALYKDRSNEGVLKYFDTTDNKYKYFYDDLQNEFPFTLNVKLASGLEQSSDRNDTEPSYLPEIKYIPQNHLSNLVDRSKKNGNTLKELIKDLILENDDNDIFKDFDANINANNTEKSKDIDVFFDIKDTINTLKKDLQDKGSKDILITSIKSKRDEILELQKDISEENKALYNQYNEEIQKFTDENKKIVSDYGVLKSLNQKIKISLDQLLLDKNESINTLENEEIKTEFTVKYNFIQNSLDELNQIEKLLSLNENKSLINDSSIKNQLTFNNQKRIELQDKIKPLIGQKESQEKIERLQNYIQQENEKLEYIIKIEKQITQFTIELATQKEKIFSSIENNFNQYQKVITDLEPITKNIEHKDNDEIDIEGFTKFNFKKFKESIDNITDLRKLKAQNPFEYLYDNNLNNLSLINKTSIINELKNVFETIHTGNYPLIKDFNIKEACRILLENHFFDHWEVKSGSDTIHNMSTGKASFVLLKLIIKLSKSEAPILIDQP